MILPRPPSTRVVAREGLRHDFPRVFFPRVRLRRTAGPLIFLSPAELVAQRHGCTHTGCPTSGGQFTFCLVDTILAGTGEPFKMGSLDAYTAHRLRNPSPCPVSHARCRHGLRASLCLPPNALRSECGCRPEVAPAAPQPPRRTSSAAICDAMSHGHDESSCHQLNRYAGTKAAMLFHSTSCFLPALSTSVMPPPPGSHGFCAMVLLISV